MHEPNFQQEFSSLSTTGNLTQLWDSIQITAVVANSYTVIIMWGLPLQSPDSTRNLLVASALELKKPYKTCRITEMSNTNLLQLTSISQCIILLLTCYSFFSTFFYTKFCTDLEQNSRDSLNEGCRSVSNRFHSTANF